MTSQFNAGAKKSADKQPAGDPVIEGMRGLAALMVVATHYSYMLTFQVGLWGFASTGVDLFFVLSGYVFAPYVLGKPLSLWPHLIRRLFRLYPLYLTALLLYVGLRIPAPVAWDYFWVHLLMGHTLGSLAVASFYNPAFWSLPPEVEFYIVLPVLAWLSARNLLGRFNFVWLLVAAAVMHLALVATAQPAEKEFTNRAIATIHLPGLLVEFLLGSFAYAISRQNIDVLLAKIRISAGFVVLAFTAFLFAKYVIPVNGVPRIVLTWIGGNIGLGAALGYALIVSGIVKPPADLTHNQAHFSNFEIRIWAKATIQNIFLWAGHLSYGIYLFHNAAPQILRRLLPETTGMTVLLACTFITLTLTFVMHHIIEKPMRAYGRTLSHKAARLK